MEKCSETSAYKIQTPGITQNFSYLSAYEDGSVPKRRNIKFRRRGITQKNSSYLPMKMEKSVPKRRHIKFRRRGITQKKAYNIQNTAKV
jgi:hypothetical protein